MHIHIHIHCSHGCVFTTVSSIAAMLGTFEVVKIRLTCENVPHMDTRSFSGSHMPGAEFTRLIICRNSDTDAQQRYTSSVLERLFRQGPGCKPSGWWIAAEAEDPEIKGARLLPCMWHRDTYGLIIPISTSSGVEAKWRRVFCSLSLRSGFSSVHLSALHMLIFRPRSADEANFSNLQFAQLFSIIPPSLLLSFPLVQLCAEITCWLTAKAN